MIPIDLAPMELLAVDEIPSGDVWQYEPKWDGFRCIAHRSGDDIALTSKNGQPLARYFPEIVRAMREIPGHDVVLDGELVVPLGDKLSFDALQQRIHPAESRIRLLAETTPAFYMAFDLLRDDDGDWVDRPLAERRRELERVASCFAPRLRLSPATHQRSVVDDWFARTGGALDGVVAKRLDAHYRSGKRDGGVKIKRKRTADCVVGGFRYASSDRGRVGSLLLGLYDEEGLLDSVGFCSAFSAAERVALLKLLEPYVGGTGFTGNAPGGTPSRWSRDRDRDRSYVALEPKLVLEVSFDQVTAGRIRHGTKPLRWRSDKSPSQCTVDQLAIAPLALQVLASA